MEINAGPSISKRLVFKVKKLLKGTLARDFGLSFFIIKRMLLVP
jgi:hypothetical protein